jgi:hypothetical protein
VVDLGNLQGFKSPQTFRHFTSGLRQHLDYNNLKKETSLKAAMDSYLLAIAHEGGNAASCCNLGDLLYYQFTYEANERAIEAYLSSLQTDKAVLRARAFRGLANAFCQKRQRHNRGGRGALEGAMRWAKFASALCNNKSALPREEQASIRKAEAYAKQVWAEFGPPEERNSAFQEAVDLYRRAIDLNEHFTAAYNNVSHLYLKRAEKELTLSETKTGAEREDLKGNAAGALEEAEKWCEDAIKSDCSFHMAYDNKGNISVAWARIEKKSAQARLISAVECYHEALSYRPAYREAYSDLADVHSRLFGEYEAQASYSMADAASGVETGFIDQQCHHATLAWQYHWDALMQTSDPTSKRNVCRQFTQPYREDLAQMEVVFASLDLPRAESVKCSCLERKAEG